MAYGGEVSDTTPPDATPDEPVSDDESSAPTGIAGAPVPVAPEETGYSPGGVPTFDYVREKIETRIGTSIGAAELAAETPEGRSVEEQYEARQKAAADRLARIRESMKTETD